MNQTSNNATTTNKFPENLTMDQADEFPFFHSFYSQKDVFEFTQKHGGQPYTQVDDESEEGRSYAKGYHLVNRTGFYIVVDFEDRKAEGCTCSSCQSSK